MSQFVTESIQIKIIRLDKFKSIKARLFAIDSDINIFVKTAFMRPQQIRPSIHITVDGKCDDIHFSITVEIQFQICWNQIIGINILQCVNQQFVFPFHCL